MPTWRAFVDGHALDLETLLRAFPRTEDSDSLVFESADEGTYFTSPRFAALAEAADVHRESEDVLREAMGVARMLDSSFQTVKLQGRYQQEGSATAFVFASAEIRVRATASATLSGGVPTVRAPVGHTYSALAASNDDVAEALALMGGDAPPSWFELYKVYEIIKHDLGGESSLLTTCSTTRAELTTFTESANRREISGTGARHARITGTASGRQMELTKARLFIARLLQSWLDSLAVE
jgi:hypothetical protein